MVAQVVMSRRRGGGTLSPPYSPRYFSPEMFRIVDGLERTMDEIRELRRSA
jgi:hypothetical protein